MHARQVVDVISEWWPRIEQDRDDRNHREHHEQAGDLPISEINREKDLAEADPPPSYRSRSLHACGPHAHRFADVNHSANNRFLTHCPAGPSVRSVKLIACAPAGPVCLNLGERTMNSGRKWPRPVESPARVPEKPQLQLWR